MSTSVEEDQSNKEERKKQGEFVRGVSTARNHITVDGEFPPEPNRYHIYVAYNCPWCHRVTLAQRMLELEDSISIDVLHPTRNEESRWQFRPDGVTGMNGRHVTFDECTKETVLGGLGTIPEVYHACGITDQTSVPILIDKKTKKIVSNESAEIIKMFNTHREALRGKKSVFNNNLDLRPTNHLEEIDKFNERIYNDINNGAYKAGFSSNQDVSDQAHRTYFAALDWLEETLSQKNYLCGSSNPTEADLRLFPTLFRHDAVYYLRMKLNTAFIKESYPAVQKWLCRMWQTHGVKEASKLNHCKQGYFGRTGNGVVPLGPPGYPECFDQQLSD